MWKKLLLLVLAAGLTAAANTRMCCSVKIDGQELDGVYSPGAVTLGRHVAALTADEIVREDAEYPELRRHYSLCLGRPSGTVAALSDAVLRRTGGVDITDGVYVDGERLGAVEDGELLCRRLSEFITNQLPLWADAGDISGDLDIYSQYSRAGELTDVDDMVLLISGMAPVYYYDYDGHISRA